MNFALLIENATHVYIRAAQSLRNNQNHNTAKCNIQITRNHNYLITIIYVTKWHNDEALLCCTDALGLKLLFSTLKRTCFYTNLSKCHNISNENEEYDSETIIPTKHESYCNIY